MSTVSQRILDALSHLPRQASEILAPAHFSKGFRGILPAKQVEEAKAALHGRLVDLIAALLPVAALYARPAISGFHVGGVAVGSSGNIYYGANLEIPAQPLTATLHAEQAAILNAWIGGEANVRSLALSAPPCGYCRQFLYEIAGGSELEILVNKDKPVRLGDLLPQPFGPALLGSVGWQLNGPGRRLSLSQQRNDEVVAAALMAASQSYAPYSQTCAGVALQLNDGSILSGRSAENVAFNPSVAPLIAALSQVALAGQEWTSLRRAVLVESAAGRISYRACSEQWLRAVCDIQLEVYLAE